MNVAAVRAWPRTFAWTAYLVATLLILVPPADVVVQLPSLDWGTVSWRFGFMGLIAGSMMLPILGAFIWMITARVMGHRWMSRIVGVGTAVAAVALTMMMVLFVLDGIEMRSQVRPEVLPRFDAPVIKSLLGQILMIVTLALLSATSFRGLKDVEGAREAQRDGIVVGAG